MARPCFALALCAAALCGCSSTNDPETPGPPAPARGGVYSEVPPAEVEPHVGLLEAHGLTLVQVVTPTDIGSEPLRSLIDACAARGVDFRAWIVLDQADGYWPGETNAASFGQAVDAFLAWVAEDALPVGWLTFDMEPDWAYTEELMTIARDETNPDRTDLLVELIRSHRDPAAFAVSTQQYTAIVDRVHAAGLRAHAVTYPVVLDDLADGDADIQDGFDTPIEDIAWDEVTFMAYRTAMQSLGGTPVATELFYSYGLSAREAFGETAGLDFGLVGPGMVNMEGSYEDPGVLRADVAAARAAGIDRMQLYSFEGTRGEPDTGEWLDFHATPPAAPPDDAGTHAIRVMFTLLDGLLDDGP